MTHNCFGPALLTASGNDLAHEHPGVLEGDIPDGQAPDVLAPAVLLLARGVSEITKSINAELKLYFKPVVADVGVRACSQNLCPVLPQPTHLDMKKSRF